MNYKDKSNQFSSRLILLYLAILISFAIITKQLWHLQIKQGKYFKELSDNNRFKTDIIAPPRGLVYDRNGSLLIDNRPRFDLIATLEEIKKPEIEASILAKILSISQKEALKKITTRTFGLPRYAPSIVLTDLSAGKLIRAYENLHKLPGIDITTKPVRHYIHGELGAHLLGYTGQIKKEKLNNLKDKGYTLNDRIGKKGVEYSYEKYLRGIPGGRQIQVNNLGQLDKVYGEKKPRKGHDIYLTIDLKIQKACEASLTDSKGSIIVMNVKTGAILAMTSKPSFNPNDFSTGISSQIRKYFVDNERPLFNRSISSQFAPGSIFKPMVAIAGLKTNFITDTTSVFCNGKFKLGNIIFKCWRKWGHGEVDLNKSLEQSCNIFYYNLGKEMGWEPTFETCQQFGFGKKTKIKLIGEKKGLLPSKQWKQKNFKHKSDKKWHLGDTINCSIGQGYLLTTPIQLACMTAGIASKGQIPQPYYVKQIVNHKNETIYQPKVITKKVEIPEAIIEKIRIGMFNVVNAKYGTGRKSKVKGINSAGKTGTAQVKTRTGEIKNTWFISFAPFEEPEIAIVVLVENADSGGSSAAPIAKKIIAAYFNVQLEEDIKHEEQVITTVDSDEVLEIENIELKPEQKKPEQKKPEQKKPEQKKPELPNKKERISSDKPIKKENKIE